MEVTCYVALAFVGLCLWGYGYQMYYHYDRVVPGEGAVHTYRMILFYGLYVTKFLLFLSYALFAVFQLQGVRRGDLFPRRNVLVINAVALLSFLSSIFSTNVKEVYRAAQESDYGSLELTDSSFGILLLLLIFAQVYRIAGRLARENQLTI